MTGARGLEVAGPDDEPQLRRLLREVPMAGAVSLSFEREPDFFHAAGIAGARTQVVVLRAASGIIGMGSLTRREMYVNGEPERVGYLGNLRALPGRRDIRALWGAFRVIHDLLEHDPVKLCVTSIVSDNDRARAILVRGTRAVPIYERHQRICTVAISPSSWRRGGARYAIGPATREDLPALVRCLERHGARKQFAVRWTAADLESAVTTRGLALSDFLVARDRGEIAGCIALWDQRAFKQVVVRGYSRTLAVLRPLANLAAPLTGMPRLPPRGGELVHAYLSHLAVDDDDESLTLDLLDAAVRRGRRFSYLLLGLCARDPRLESIGRCFRPRRYYSDLYVVRWPDRPVPTLDDRPAAPEVAIL